MQLETVSVELPAGVIQLLPSDSSPVLLFPNFYRSSQCPAALGHRPLGAGRLTITRPDDLPLTLKNPWPRYLQLAQRDDPMVSLNPD